MTTANLALQDNQALIQYTSTGGASYATNFPVLDPSELRVSLDQALQSYGSDYVIASGLGSAGGVVVNFPGGTTAGQRVTLWLDMPIERLSGFQAGAATLLPEDLNADAVQQLRVAQQLRRDIGRALRLPIDDTVAGVSMQLPLAADRLGRILAFSQSNGGVELLALTEIGGLVTALSSSLIATTLNSLRRTDAEIAAGVTPADFSFAPGDPRRYGAIEGDSLDATAAFNEALLVAFHGGPAVTFEGVYRIAGTLDMPLGTSLRSRTSAWRYYVGQPWPTAVSGALHKHAADSAGPIVLVNTGCAVENMLLQHDQVGGATLGIVQMGPVGTSENCYKAVVRGCEFYGHAINNMGAFAAADCRAVHFPDSNETAGQRYQNAINDNWFVNCDIGIRAGSETNGCNFDRNFTRQVYRPIVFDGTNSFGLTGNSALGCNFVNIGLLPGADSYVFTWIGAVQHCIVSGHSEANGRPHDTTGLTTYSQLDDAGFVFNESIGSNELPADAWATSKVARTKVNRLGQQFVLANDATPPSNPANNGLGCSVEQLRQVQGTLPQMASSDGALAAADADSRRIILLDSDVYVKTSKVCLYGELTLKAANVGDGGEHLTRVRFVSRVTNFSSAAAVLEVLEVEQSPAADNHIRGLYFLTGVASGRRFGIAVVGGHGGSVSMAQLVAHLKLHVSGRGDTFSYASMRNISYTSTACDADDVTDAIDLLTVAETAF